MSTVTDYYDNVDDFEAALDEAESAATTDRECEFVEDLRGKLEEWGEKMFFSESQAAWLSRIIDRG